MRDRNSARRARSADHLAHADILAGDDVKARHVGVERRASAAVINDDQLAVCAAPFGFLDDAVGGNAHRRPHRGRDIHAGMEGLKPAERIVAAAEMAQHAPVDQP